MIGDNDLVVLDTNVLVHIGRGKEVKDWLEHTLKLLSRPRRCIVSRVTHAEMAVFMADNAWGAKRDEFMRKLLDAVITVEITAPGVQDAYVDLDLRSRRHPPGAIKMKKNDLWIAATTRAIKGTLITSDNDFDHLHPAGIRVARYSPDAIIAAVRGDHPPPLPLTPA